MKTMQDFKKEHMLKEYSSLGGLLRREPILIGSIVKYQMINNDDAIILD